MWTNGFEESRIILLPKPFVLAFGVLCSMVRATIRGAAYFIYACSNNDSSLVPKAKIIDHFDVDLLQLSSILEKLGETFNFSVDYILELSSGVLLDVAPRVRRVGFGKDLAEFGNQGSFSFYVPFEGLSSYFTTSSSQLAKMINGFVVERNAGVLHRYTPSWSKTV